MWRSRGAAPLAGRCRLERGVHLPGPTAMLPTPATAAWAAERSIPRHRKRPRSRCNVVNDRIVVNATWTSDRTWPTARREDGALGRRGPAAGPCPRSSRHAAAKPDAVLQRVLTDEPMEQGQVLDGLGNCFAKWRPDQIRDPQQRRIARRLLRSDRGCSPGAGKLGNAKKGSLKGPGTGWWIGFDKDIIAQGDLRCSFRDCR